MAEDPFRYDIAFSFLSRDESVATELNDLLKDRWRTFIYFEHQKRLAGRDGEQLFNRVFGNETRLAVVLHRPDWGSTAWTRIEQTAIRNRGFGEGYDFTVFVPLDTPPSKPAWLPNNRLWANLARFGVQGAAAAIDQRLHEVDASPHPESVEAMAARLAQGREEAHAKAVYLANHGSTLAEQEAQALMDALTRLIASVGGTTERFEQRHQALFHAHGLTLGVGWYPSEYINTVEDGRLAATLWSKTYHLCYVPRPMADG